MVSVGARAVWAERRALVEEWGVPVARVALACRLNAAALEERAARQGWTGAAEGGLSRQERIARVHDRLLARIEREQLRAGDDDAPLDKAGIAELAATARILAKIGEITRDEDGAKERELERDADIRMLYQHDPAEPIGTWLDIAEDARGLHVRGRLTPGVGRAREVLELMRAGALDGLSIGFRTVKARKDARGGLRRIIEADLWEISVVTFPMLPEARVETVKGGRRLPTTREFERWLTRDAKLTRWEARAVIARGFTSLVRERDAARGTPEALAARIRDFGIVRGPFQITALEYTGNHDGEVTFDIALESAGALAFTAA